MLPTPETDKAEYEVRLGKHRRMVVRPELARQLERERNEAMKQNALIPRSGLALAELLAKHGVIQSAAIDDPEDYDGHDTIDRIHAAWEEMISAPTPPAPSKR